MNQARPIIIGDTQYPAKIFSLWSADELKNIGIVPVTFDNTNQKDNEWYINSKQTYTYDASAGTVTASYGTATAKAHADVLWTQADSDNGDLPADKSVGDVRNPGLKTILINKIKEDAMVELKKTDWYIVRKADAGTAVPSTITNHRAAVRTKAAEMETSITNAADTEALKTLFTYVNTADEGEPDVMARPIGNLPTLES
tara:strand:- start:9 stop:608 length:600 start_codon:yes stop_codon:yes gene_type:complete